MAESDRPTATPSSLDLRAIEQMIREGRIERGVHRFGAVQEVFVVDRSWSPAPRAAALLERLADSHFTGEIGPCHLELEADPLILSGDGLSRMEREISRLFEKLCQACSGLGLYPVLTGILPTIRDGSALDESLTASFRVHVQVSAEDFARLYNIAQVVAGPWLSATANSPLLFGEQRWAESRIWLSQEVLDPAAASRLPRHGVGRESFGTGWVKESILEVFGAPRWNCASCAIVEGAPCLRIENRIMPSGPSVLDESANAAYWLGLMTEMGAQHEDVTKHFEHDRARANFYAAAQAGIGSRLTWLDGAETSAQDLALSRLLPMAESGLRKRGIVEDDIRRYLGVVEQRVRSTRTGARWMSSSLAGMESKGTAAERLDALVAATVARQGTGRPVSEWERARLDESERSRDHYRRVEQYMRTDFFTVHQNDAIGLIADLMGRERIRHLPVEDLEHRLVGLVSYRSVLRHLMASKLMRKGQGTTVADIMRTDVTTVTPQTPTVEAIALMRRYRIGCVPVVSDGRLVGIVTEEDFMDIAADLLEQKLSVGGDPET